MPENSVSEIARQGFAEQNRFSETAHSRRATAVCASLHRRRLAAPERSGDLEQNRREAVCMTSVGQMDRVCAIHDRKAALPPAGRDALSDVEVSLRQPLC